MAAHQGVMRTAALIKRCFYWPRVQKDGEITAPVAGWMTFRFHGNGQRGGYISENYLRFNQVETTYFVSECHSSYTVMQSKISF